MCSFKSQTHRSKALRLLSYLLTNFLFCCGTTLVLEVPLSLAGAFPNTTVPLKFLVSSSSLLKHLQQISGVINSNTVLPILEDFLFEIQDKKLSVTATDLETVMRVQMDVESKTNGKVCIPAKILLDSLKNIADQPLTFNIDKNFAVEITSDNGKYKVMGENPDNFPKEPAAPPISTNSAFGAAIFPPAAPAAPPLLLAAPTALQFFLRGACGAAVSQF